ncbi:MAG TPA: hypothetical protein VIA18_25665 [Polyangia bacterium]|jgi:hypothetical protein|nr:hypothetical protein [Polyangia bacterium]
MAGAESLATSWARRGLVVCTLLAGCAYQPLPNGSGATSEVDAASALATPGATTTRADMAFAQPDPSGPTDLAPSDLAQADPSHPDLAPPPDLSVSPDLSEPRDLSLQCDLAQPYDLSLSPDLTTPSDLATPPDRSACTSYYRNWLMYDRSLAASAPCGLDSLQCGWAAFPACSSVSLATTTEPAAGQIDWSLNEVGLVGDFVGSIDDHGHFYTINEYFSGSTFVGDIDASCNVTGTIDWVPDQLCIDVRQVSVVPQ